MERLRINQGGYRGEQIDVSRLLTDLEQAANAGGWQWKVMEKVDGFEIPGLRRQAANTNGHIYLSAGIHGDEAAGPLALLELLRENQWPSGWSYYLCPVLNPTGLARNTRENAWGIDQNRDYRDQKTPEVRAHIQWLSQQPSFDLNICLHEDWESGGFYVYELNLDDRPSLSRAIIQAAGKVCPIETADVIDTWQAERGVIVPSKARFERPDWPEALYLIHHKTRQGYTLEAPSDFPMQARVDALVAGVKAALDGFKGKAP